ncbi:MAG: hypothetical protein IPM45_01565 [Acidimicrobiales bacterium]|nr:hypothetical protein [Acidimicrobiales bacterium]
MPEPSVPSLDDLATEWLAVAQLAHMPSLHNFHRMAVCAPDVLGVHYWTGPDDLYARVGPQFLDYRSYPRLALSLDGTEVQADACRWFAYQALRRATVGGVEVATVVRLLFEESGLLTRITVRNPGPGPRIVELAVSGLGEAVDDLAWGHAGPGQLLTVPADAPHGVSTRAGSATATWRLVLGPGEAATVRLAQAEGPDRRSVGARAHQLVAGFDDAWHATGQRWAERWAHVFAPANPHFSGHLPVLETADEALAHLYYTAVLTLLVLHRTDLGLCDRVFVTSGERAHGTVFLWDTSMISRLLALLEPRGLREQVRLFLALDPLGGALVDLDTVDYLASQSAEGRRGPWYAANHLALFRLVHDYVAVTGEVAFLDERIAGRTVLAHLESLATAWRALVPDPALPLADYGDADNLLECVPTYVHRVVSLNAANVWMLRTVAALHRGRGDEARAAALLADAERVADAVVGLYRPGEGTWCCLDDEGRRLEVRHCYDFICAGAFLGDRLTDSVRAEMVGFVQRELLTASWMRAQSLLDPAAAASDRPDHGPYGAFGAWPALTAQAMFELGRFAEGVDLLHRVVGALAEGVVGQAYELWGPERDTVDAPVRIAARGFCLREGSAGGAFAETVVTHVFGFRPEIGAADPRWRSDEARPATGVLHHLRWAAGSWRLALHADGVSLTPEGSTARSPRPSGAPTP